MKGGGGSKECVNTGISYSFLCNDTLIPSGGTVCCQFYFHHL